jgi:hypothetical protein
MNGVGTLSFVLVADPGEMVLGVFRVLFEAGSWLRGCLFWVVVFASAVIFSV